MKFFKWLCTIFEKKKQTSTKLHYSKNPNGQELIYWRNYINRKNLTKVLIPLISLFIFSTILIISITPITEDEIYSTNFKYDIYGVRRGKSKSDEILNSILKKDHETSIKLLYDTLKSDSSHVLYMYYYSAILMELNKQDSAQKYLKKIIAGDNLFLDDAQWLLALSYLKTNKEMSILEFRKVSNDKNHYKQKKAKEILKDLE